jgi:hypothetical protein
VNNKLNEEIVAGFEPLSRDLLGHAEENHNLSYGRQSPGRDVKCRAPKVKQEQYPLNSAVLLTFLPRVSFQYNEIRPGNFTLKGKSVKKFSTE